MQERQGMSRAIRGKLLAALGIRAISKEGNDWLSLSDPPDYMPDFDSWRRERQPIQSLTFDDYIEDWRKRLNSKPCIIDTGTHSSVSSSIRKLSGQIDKFGMVTRQDESSYKFESKLISVIQLKSANTIELTDCVVGRLEVLEATRRSNIQLNNCWVGELNLCSSCLKSLEVNGGGIERIRCPLPYEQSPFTDSVAIKKVWLSPKSDNAQAYRNLKHHLSSMHNYEAASVFHSAEMRTIYAEQSSLEKIINLSYRVASNYGASSGRPFLWFLFFVILDFLLFWSVDGAIPVLDETTETGWREALSGTSSTNVALRAGLLVLTQIFNPLGIFGFKGFVTAKTVGLALANVVLGFFATLSLALCLLALRRRFRWSGE
jgi:hypothetical protein